MNDDDINAMMASADNNKPKQPAQNPIEGEYLFRQHLSENMHELQQSLASLYDIRDRGFAESLCEFYTNKGFLSQKQLYWAYKFWLETKSGSENGIEKLAPRKPPVDKILPPRVVVDGKILIKYFDQAAAKIDKPKIIYVVKPPVHGCERLVFYRTGEGSASPRSVGVTNGLQYPNNRILALLYRDGRTIFYPWTYDKPEVQQLIKKIAEDPLKMFSENGKMTSICCYCARQLTHPSSVHYGYGPICAGNFGLPWGDLPPAHQQLSLHSLGADNDGT